jgi:hypothetical protein
LEIHHAPTDEAVENEPPAARISTRRRLQRFATSGASQSASAAVAAPAANGDAALLRNRFVAPAWRLT